MIRNLITRVLVSVVLFVPVHGFGQRSDQKPSTGQLFKQAPRNLSGDNDKLAKEFEQQVETALKADRWV
jgi:hypothetical protein